MKRYLLFPVLFSFCLCTHGQGRECGSRQIYGFDLEVKGENPFTKWSNITDPEFYKTVHNLQSMWIELHRATPGYISQFSGWADNTSSRVIYMFGPEDENKPWLTKEYYGAPSRNYKYFMSDETLTGIFMLQPPKPDFIDYIFYGSVIHEGYLKGKIEIKALNFRENEELFTREISFNKSDGESGLEPYSAAKMIMNGFAEKFENSILVDYEKTKRDKSNEQDNGPVAIEPKMEFDQQSYSMPCSMPASCFQKMVITLKDCDGVPLKNKTIKLNSSKGKITPEKIKTDGSGKAQIFYFAVEKNYTDKISASWNFKYPSGRTNRAETNTTIKVGSPKEDIYSRVEILYHTVNYYPSKSSQRQSNDLTYMITGQLKCTIVRDRILRYKDYPGTRNECDAGTHCPILLGTSYNIERDQDNPIDERYPLEVTKNRTEMGYRNVDGKEKYVETISSKIKGINRFEALTMEIKSYVPRGGSQLAPLTDNYVIWITGSKYIDKMSQAPLGNGEYFNRDDPEKRSDPVTSGAYNIGIPYNISEPDVESQAPDINEPLLIDNVKNLDEYLVNPVGEFVIEAKSKHCFFYGTDIESEGDVIVKITLNTVPEKEPPSDDDDQNR